MHPSRRFKRATAFVVLCGIISIVALMVNEATVNDQAVSVFGQMGLLFVANMLVALVARYAINQAVWPSVPKRVGAAIVLVFASAALLFADYMLADAIVDSGDPLEDAVATLAAATVWIGAYIVSWKPFLQKAENRYIAAGISLALGAIAFFLYFRSLFARALFAGVGWKTEFVQYTLACIAFAAAASSFMVQKDASAAQKKREATSGLGQAEVEISAFDPSTDLEEAERFASKGMLFEEGMKSSIAAWAYGRDTVCEGIFGSTKMYAARYHGALVGLLFASEKGIRKPYARSRYALFHKAFALLEAIRGRADDVESFNRARAALLESADAPCNVEILLFLTDPELKGKGVGSKLLDAFKRDFPNGTALLLADNTLPTSYFEKRGFSPVTGELFETGVETGDGEEQCQIFTKQIGETRKDTNMTTNEAKVTLEPLKEDDREQFILDNQEAFNYGALEEFGMRDDTFEEDGQIIARETIEESIDSGDAWRIVEDGKVVGGAVVSVDGDHGELDLLFVKPDVHSKGVGYAAWCAIEKMYPNVRVWGLVTPYFETRNIHFYVNRCGFHIVEFFNPHHPEPDWHDGEGPANGRGTMDFRFEKVMPR
jgi:GNAT superfamily N-acetyltransferase